MRIFIDAMGGDRAPETVLAGVQLATKEVRSELILVGDESVLNPLVRKLSVRPTILHCSENIDMGESPVQAVRAKRDSSIVRGLRAAAETPRSAFFSAGHSGAVFAAALLEMRRLRGVERPAIATTLPTITTSRCLLLDAGANVDCRPNHLVEFALMGSTYVRITQKKERPTVGILSNGEEDSKGTDLTRAAHALLKVEQGLNYVGYVEGKEIFLGKMDVVVTDGFTGNVVLKSCEGLGKAVSTTIRRELGRSAWTKLGALFAMPALRQVQKKLDYAEVGSAPLLGVDGNCFIGHGRSSPRAIKNGILRAEEAIELGLHEKLRELFSTHMEARDA